MLVDLSRTTTEILNSKFEIPNRKYVSITMAPGSGSTDGAAVARRDGEWPLGCCCCCWRHRVQIANYANFHTLFFTASPTPTPNSLSLSLRLSSPPSFRRLVRTCDVSKNLVCYISASLSVGVVFHEICTKRKEGERGDWGGKEGERRMGWGGGRKMREGQPLACTESKEVKRS